MLLAAGPSQAAYPTTSNHPAPYSPAVSRLTISSSSTVSKSNDSVRSPQSTSTPSSNRFSLMKSISSQLNRGTELLKQTVQRAIFSSKASVSVEEQQEPPNTVKPTPFHLDPHAVTRSSSVDSLHPEECHIRPIHPYSQTPFRPAKGHLTNYARRPGFPARPVKEYRFQKIKVKRRFKLQKDVECSAFCPVQEPQVESVRTNAKKVEDKGTKRKRSLPEEELGDDEPHDVVEEPKITAKRGRKTVQKVEKPKAVRAAKKPASKATAKRKSLEQEKQEREDFELAKQLQKELNSSNESIGSTNVSTTSRRTRNGRSHNSSSSVSNRYSLRTTRSLSSERVATPEEDTDPEPVVEVKRKVSQTTKKGLKTVSNNSCTRTTGRGAARRKRGQAVIEEEHDEEDEPVMKAQSPPSPPANKTSRRTTIRSKGNCRSTK